MTKRSFGECYKGRKLDNWRNGGKNGENASINGEIRIDEK